jgi:hypothetical protein
MRESLRSMWTSQEPGGPPFIGCVGDDSFSLRRHISGRNSFLPRIKGRIIPTNSGTRINVIMFIHPFSALFMTFWLGVVGYGALRDTSAFPAILWGMFLFGVTLILVCFFPEALKARRMLHDLFLDSSKNGAK